jgi:hypothetical protein
MNETVSFVDSIKKHFGFLSVDYNFIMRESIGQFGQMIEFQSPKLGIQVCKDRGSIFVLLKPAGEPAIAQLGLTNILEALSVIQPKNIQGPVAPAQYDDALAYYAASLKMHCDNLLRGNLSGWVGFLEFVLNKMKSDYLLWTKGKQLPQAVYQELEDYIRSKSST